MKLQRLRLFLAHLAISAALVGSCIAFIVLVWYPPPYAQLEGIYKILLVLAFVDICAGPLCTLVAASPGKPARELRRDLAIIAAIQLFALSYGIYTSAIARPAYVVYNVGQFDIAHANELTPEELAKAKGPEFGRVPWDGPHYVAARFPQDPKEAMKIINSATAGGADIQVMPQYFLAWPGQDPDARTKGKPVSKLHKDGPTDKAVRKFLAKKGVGVEDAIVFAIFGKIEPGTVIVRQSDLTILGIVPYVIP